MRGNMFSRIGRLLDATPVVRAIYDEILRELRSSGTFIETFGRMNPRFWSGDEE